LQENVASVTVDAGFVDPTLDAKRFSAPTKHFRHKWKTIEGAVIVERGQYFIADRTATQFPTSTLSAFIDAHDSRTNH